MVSKPERGRYLTLEDVRVSYKHKDDTIHLTSADPDIPNGSFYITLNRDTPTEEALRELLIEQGYIKENSVVMTPEKTTLESIYSYRPRNPLQDLLVDSLVGRGDVNFPRYVHISGQSGHGKTFLALRTVEDASAMGINTYVVSSQAGDYQEKIQGSAQVIKLQDLPDGALNPFSLGLQAGGILKLLVAFAQLTDEAISSDSSYYRLLWTKELSNALSAVGKLKDPTLDKLLTIIRASKNREFDNRVGDNLEQLQKTEFGRLLFGKSNYMGKIAENQNTIFDIGDLAYISDDLSANNYTVAQRAAVLIKKLVIDLLNRKITASNRPTLFVVEESPEFIEEMTRIIRSKNCTLISVSKEPINKYTSSLSSASYHYLSSIAHEMIGGSTNSDTQDAVDLPLDKLSTGEFFWYDINTGHTEFYKSTID